MYKLPLGLFHSFKIEVYRQDHFSVWTSTPIRTQWKILTTLQNDLIHIKILSKFHRKGLVQGAEKSLARPGRKKAAATEDFDFHISYL